MKNGFTLIEFLIVISIILVSAAVGLTVFSNLYSSVQIDEATTQIIQTLRTARERGVASYNSSAHGACFILTKPYKYILYQGSSYADRNIIFDREVILSQALSLKTTGLIASSSYVDINFSQNLGLPNNIGTITIYYNSDNSRLVEINSAGLVQEK